MLSTDTSLPDPETESGKVDWESLFRVGNSSSPDCKMTSLCRRSADPRSPAYQLVLPVVDIALPSFDEAAYFFRHRLAEVNESDGPACPCPKTLRVISDSFLDFGVAICVIKV